ncbi:MAG: redox-sensing transcriptional repressor Rex [Spirochaetes bacterium]|nr:redox-sensing transcriptional repressor Rex [Spirochaetota bacterium]
MPKNQNAILRLSRYKNTLYKLKTLGLEKVFSDNLADSIHVKSSQVRKDFSIFGIEGHRKGGYEINYLINKINEVLGKTKMNNVILAGAGKLGRALMGYKGFNQVNIKITAIFDIDPEKVKRDSPVPVLPLEEMKEYIKNNHIVIGIIAVPEEAAQLVVEHMIGAGVKGLLNFSTTNIKVPDHVIVNNVHMEAELENIIYYINNPE